LGDPSLPDENRIKTEKGCDVKTSNPIVVFRETVLTHSRAFEGRSPNKHNMFFIEAVLYK